ncbi:chemotaxis protein CheA [Paraglaciecola chathamensis]|uniref:Chemotaxis protein CheA n=1 Tax=Paraglaciecola chathamensis TaxID=368405 RepID=A0ABS0WCW4_9ALTE|nr:chemotaxis protein CheA [Paraglaciecola chathamensis]MBJ2136263.1 chemotaxis protein CheA [Paraglaciecola chathamensis]
MSIDMEQFHGVFFDESQEHLADMEQQLMELDLSEPDPEQLNSIFRAAHSIKGGSGIFGFDALTGLTHIMENLLDRARNNTIEMTTPIVDLLLETTDLLKVTLDNYRNQEEIEQADIDQGISKLNILMTSLEDSTAQNSSNTVDDGENDENENNEGVSGDLDGFGFFDDEPSDALTAQIDDDDEDGFGFFEPPPATASEPENDENQGFGFFDTTPTEIAATNAGNSTIICDTAPTAAESIDKGYGFFPENEHPKDGPSDNKKGYGFFEKLPVPSAKSKKTSAVKEPKKNAAKSSTAKASVESSSIRVDTVKIDSLVNLIGELVITQSMLSQVSSDMPGEPNEKLQNAIAELTRNTREIQESVMSMRMLPMHFTFNRFPRVVRDLSSKLGKKVDLVIEGGNTEIDKGMIEKLVDPLTHLVRNSIDHGIEKTEDRLALGKAEMGTVILKAEQKGSSIIISIIDDGAGLNRERILAKAQENGMSVDVDMPDSDVWKLIFEAGFSTAEAVTDVSGRGVGMDVVRRNLEAIGGRIEIESSQGEGSSFNIHLPLTLAIVDGICVSVASQTFVVPLVNIIESVQPDPSQMKLISNEKLLWIRDQYWPLVKLHQKMQIEGAITEPSEAIVMLIESSNKRFGLLVDGLMGQQQVVIKSLEQNYRRVDGVAGATIMGDGQVALILDVESLANSVKANGMSKESIL